jgi:hypothetical protein
VEDSSDNGLVTTIMDGKTINNDGCNAMQWSRWQELEHRW